MNHNITQVWKCSDGETFSEARAAERHQLRCDAVNEIQSSTGVSLAEAAKIMTKPNAVISILQEYLAAMKEHLEKAGL